MGLDSCTTEANPAGVVDHPGLVRVGVGGAHAPGNAAGEAAGDDRGGAGVFVAQHRVELLAADVGGELVGGAVHPADQGAGAQDAGDALSAKAGAAL